MSDQYIDTTDIITGWCSKNECPPGTVWGCCPDDSVEYPPGEPGFKACEIKTYSTSQFAYSHNFLTEIGDYLWSTSYTSWTNYNLYDKTGTKVKTISFPSLPDDDGRPYHIPAGNTRGFPVVESGGLVWTLTDTWFGDHPNRQFVIIKFDLEGNYVDYVLTPIEYQLDIVDGRVQLMAYNNGVIMCCPNSYVNQALRSSRFIWFDYYGTVYHISDTTGQTPSVNIHSGHSANAISGNYLFSGYVHEYGSWLAGVNLYNASNGDFIKALDPVVQNLRSQFGARINVLKANGKEDVIVIGRDSDGEGNSGDYPGINDLVWVFRPNGDLIKMITMPLDQPYGNETTAYNIPCVDSMIRYGDIYLLTYNKSDCLTTQPNGDAKGVTYILDKDFNIINTVPRSYPEQSRGDELGNLQWMGKDILLQHSGNSSSGAKYFKVCKVNWSAV